MSGLRRRSGICRLRSVTGPARSCCLEPGAEWNYSVATDVLGHLVEVGTGRSLEEFFRAEISDRSKCWTRLSPPRELPIGLPRSTSAIRFPVA
jgi:hypothetical protein